MYILIKIGTNDKRYPEKVRKTKKSLEDYIIEEIDEI